MDEAANVRLSEVIQTEIPKVVHFIMLQDKPDTELSMFAYLAVKSAHDMLQPERIILHFHNLPKGKWMDLARPFLTLREVEIPTEVFGIPVKRVEHQADILRLQILQEFGGIYLDTDIISLKSIDHLLNETTVMGLQGSNLGDGLCNAVIISRANSPFITRWFAAYKHFDDGSWDYHSVKVPGMLAGKYTDEIRVLPMEAIFKPSFFDRVKEMFEGRVYDFSSNLMVHLWGSASKNELSQLSPKVIQDIDTSLNCAIRKFLPETHGNETMDRTCYFPKQTNLADKLVGYWPMNRVPQEHNDVFERLEDVSGNNLHGFSKYGTYDKEKAQTRMALSKDDSFIKLPVLSEAKMNNLTISWIMTLPENGPAGMDTLIVESDKFTVSVVTIPDGVLGVNAGGFTQRTWMPTYPENIIMDDQEHLYTLLINTNSKSIVLYQDEKVIGISDDWKPDGDPKFNKLTHLWFKGHQSLRTSYRDIRIWNKEFDAEAMSKFVRITKKK